MTATTETSEDAIQTSISGLQKLLRSQFAKHPPYLALIQSLGRIGEYFEATYAVMHGCLGAQMLSEEWATEGFEPPEPLRESINETMGEAMGLDRTRCVRIGRDNETAPAVVATPLHDESGECAGAAGLVLKPCTRAKTLETMALFEAMAGYLAVLAAGREPVGQGVDADSGDDEVAVATHPMRLALTMAARLKNRHGLDQVAIGFVAGHDVEVAAVSGVDTVRASNPGVKLIRAAMLECLDRRTPVVHYGNTDTATGELQDDCRLHKQWSQKIGGDAVASTPLFSGDELVAVASVRHRDGELLNRHKLGVFAEELGQFAALVPLSRLASRSVLAHLREDLRDQCRRLIAPPRARRVIGWGGALLLALWVVFGTLGYHVTVPGTVTGGARRTVSAPREGVLIELLARPGQRVEAGAVLARLDTRTDAVSRVQLTAELDRLEAEIDAARAEQRPAQARILAAKRLEVAAELEMVDLRIEQATIRAPQAGVLLSGDLRDRVGARLAMGEAMFEIERDGRTLVELEIPEQHLIGLESYTDASFAPTATPSRRIDLGKLRTAPLARTTDGRSVFVAEAEADEAADLRPGTTGFARLELGRRRVWWILTHRIGDWLRLNFWL